MTEAVGNHLVGRMGAVARRYVPGVLFLASLLVLVMLVPDARIGETASVPGAGTGVAGAGNPGASADAGATPGTTPEWGRRWSGRQPGGTVQGANPGAAGAAGNVTASGTRCGPGVRQFTFTPYSPMCVPKFTGNNGGSTAHGVTANSITLTWRQTSDFDGAASAVGASSGAAGVHDSQVLIDYLNTQYELYGRKVTLKSFNGSGSYLAEIGGHDQQGANADAQQAYDLGAFAEAPLGAPSVYASALSSRHVASFTLPDSLPNLNANYPYQYEYLSPALEHVASAAADVVCQRMANMHAIHAGDAALSAMTRSFGLVTPTQQTTGPDLLISRAKQKCGVTIPKFQYDINPAQYAPEAAQIAASLNAQHITTVILLTDIIFSPIMTSAASSDSYHPEWLDISPMTNHSSRQMSADEVSHMVFMPSWHAENFAPSQDGCYQIYLKASGGAPPQSNLTTIDLLCAPLLEFFGALQNAGPNLTPATFGQGWFNQPPSAGTGEFGSWAYGAGAYCGCSTFNFEWWNASASDPYDSTAGSPTPCREPLDLPYLNPSLGSGQLQCF